MRRRKYQIQCCNFSVLSEHMSLWWNSCRARATELWRKAGLGKYTKNKLLCVSTGLRTGERL